MKEFTVAQAFTVAIGAEKAAEKMYQGLEAKFANHADIVTFWEQYASDEAGHAKALEGMLARLTPAQLSTPVDAQTVGALQVLAGFSVEKALHGVKNLEDAHQLVSEVESGETNAIFEFLLMFEKDEQLREFLRAQLNKHITRLTDGIPARYKGVLYRKAIQALE
jgi:rubrerythrin